MILPTESAADPKPCAATEQAVYTGVQLCIMASRRVGNQYLACFAAVLAEMA